MTESPAEREKRFRREVEAERLVARVASEQHGMVTTEQLKRAGFGANQITRRCAGGWLARRQQGVYLLGVVPGEFGNEMAALLAAGPRAALSHWTAVTVFGVGRRPSLVHVLVASGYPGRRAGIRPHRTAALRADEVVVRHGLRVTTPPRTLVDLAATTPPAELERLVEEMQVQELATPEEIRAAVRRAAGRPGVRKLRVVTDLLDEPSFTRSAAEQRLIRLVRAARLPLPRTNVKRAGWEVDAVWDRERLVVEVDGYRFHRTRAKFERDRRKDAELMLKGFRVLRVTWRQLTKEPESVIATIAAALGATR